MNQIVPSTKLKVITVHKLKSLTCLRKYFWRWILNLEPRQINLNFWYGGVLGAGFEALLLGKNPEKAMNAEDKKRRQRHLATSDIEDEMRLQRQLISAFIKQAKKHPEVKKMKLKTHQEKLKVHLKKSRLLFCGTPDGPGTYAGKPHLFEIKTAKQVNAVYIDALTFDKQVYGYAYARKLLQKPVLPKCCYCIFRKSQKRIKRNQTIDEFVREIEEDLADPNRTGFYFIFHRFGLGSQTIAEVGYDIEQLASDLLAKHRGMSKKELLNPHCWPKQESKCSEYRGCEYLQLCKRPNQWKLYLRFYQQRERLYREEDAELEIS